MNLNNTFDEFQDFTITMADGIPVLKFNMLRATIKETKAFKQNLIQLMAANHRFIIIDFSDCAFIDSAIVGVMVTLVKDFRNKKGDLLAITPPGTINNMFAQTGLDRVIKRFESLSSALASLSV
ncbi:MAG: STAS domain-containing protein [Ignavibacterium sp.]|jgi:anti-anti-sigma factor|nr:STAS domain-containing protein [Ignavibacterium sp.]